MAVVLIIRDPKTKIRLEMTSKVITFGRSSKADMTLADELISSVHLSISLKNNKELFIKDLGSTNGTFLNGSQIDMTKMYTGDTISFGKSSIDLDREKLTSTEEKNFNNSDKTSIRFINVPKEKTINSVVDEDEDEDSIHVSTNNQDIVLNFDDDSSKASLSDLTPKITPPTEEEAPTIKADDLDKLESPDQEFGDDETTRLEENADLEEVKKRRLKAKKTSEPLGLKMKKKSSKASNKSKRKKTLKKDLSLIEKVLSFFKK